jgi:hypothetical protein
MSAMENPEPRSIRGLQAGLDAIQPAASLLDHLLATLPGLVGPKFVDELNFHLCPFYVVTPNTKIAHGFILSR